MKKLTFTLLIILALTLSACGATETATAEATSALSTDYENALSIQMQLSIGTFELEETEFAVDAEQAKELIPLWQVLKNLLGSDAAAQEEITALLTQIEETMTAEQIASVSSMQLTRENMGAIMQEYGLQPEGREGETPPEGFTPGQGRGGSGVPGMGGGPGTGETGMTPEQIATMQAEREKNGGSSDMTNSRMSGVIIEGLIEFLQSK